MEEGLAALQTTYEHYGRSYPAGIGERDCRFPARAGMGWSTRLQRIRMWDGRSQASPLGRRPQGGMDRSRGSPGCGMAAAARNPGLSRGRRASRADGRERSSISPREGIPAGPALGWSRAPGPMAIHLPRCRGYRILARRRLALAHLGRRTDLPTRGEGRLLPDSRRTAGHPKIDRTADHRRRVLHRRTGGPGQQGRRHADAGSLDHRAFRVGQSQSCRGGADQGIHEPDHGPLPSALRYAPGGITPPVRVRRHRQPRQLSARRDRRAPFLAGGLWADRRRWSGRGPRPVVGGSQSQIRIGLPSGGSTHQIWCNWPAISRRRATKAIRGKR